MAKTYTARLGITKPTPGTGEPVNLSDINSAWDAVDDSIGATICTSGTRPPSPWDGQIIRETDTGRLLVYNATSTTWNQVMGPGSFSASPGGATATLRSQLASGTANGNRFLDLKGPTSTDPDFQMDYDGQMQWGPGSSAADCDLSRTGTDTMTFANNLVVTGTLQVESSSSRLLTDWYQKNSSSSLALTTTATDIPGVTQTFTTMRANALAIVTFTGDFASTASSPGTGIVRLVVDGTPVTAPQAIFNPGNTTSGTRCTATNTYLVTLASAGSHTIKAQGQMATGTSGITLQASHTGMMIQVFE